LTFYFSYLTFRAVFLAGAGLGRPLSSTKVSFIFRPLGKMHGIHCVWALNGLLLTGFGRFFVGFGYLMSYEVV